MQVAVHLYNREDMVGHCYIRTLGKLLHQSASDAKQYNSLPVKKNPEANGR